MKTKGPKQDSQNHLRSPMPERKVWRYQRSRKSKDRQYNGQKKKGIRTNNNLQNITEKIKDPATRTSLKTGGELWWYGSLSRSCCYTCGTCRVTLVTSPVAVIGHDRGKDWIVIMINATYLWSILTQITVNKVMTATVKLLKWWLQLNH
jgi:hypothetical protein